MDYVTVKESEAQENLQQREGWVTSYRISMGSLGLSLNIPVFPAKS